MLICSFKDSGVNLKLQGQSGVNRQLFLFSSYFLPTLCLSSLSCDCHPAMFLLAVSTIQGHSKHNFGFVSNCCLATCFDPIYGLSLFLCKADNDPGI